MSHPVEGPRHARNQPPTLLEFFRHHGVWAPGVRLFRRIQFNTKAAIISAIFLLPILVLGWNYFNDKAAAIAFSAKERDGVGYARELLPLITMAQQQRSLLTQAPGTVVPEAELAALRSAIDRQWKGLEAVHGRLGEWLAAGQAYQRVQQTRAALDQTGTDADQRHAAHSAHVDTLIALLTQAADGSNLTLDPDLDSYYLMDGVTAAMPQLIEATTELRDLVAAIAAGVEVTPTRLRDMHRAEAIGDLSEERLAAAFPKIYSLRPQFRAAFQDDALRKSLHAFHDRVASGQADAPNLLREGTAVVDAHVGLQTKMLVSLDEVLAERIAALSGQRNAAAAVVALALALGFYLFYAFFLVTQGGLREVQKHLEAMSAGDLTTQPVPWGRDEAAQLMRSLSDMQMSLRNIVHQVRGASDHIVHSSSEISSGALDLSARTEQAAANLQQSAASMEEISSVVKNTAEGAREASAIASTNAQVAQRGGQIIGTMVATMRDIHASSSKIGDIIGTIDGIAFQTNILALNAAVEAARAGESGRGFAVVAAEVRALAQRSAAAAREIKGLITASVSQVESGARVVQTAGDTMAEMVGSATRINQLLAAISSGTTEQASGVTETTSAVQELDHMTQQNAALVEQTAAAAASLKDQALRLASKVASFKLPETTRHA